MLKSFRGMAKGFGAWVLVGLFVLAFAVVGVPALNNYGGKPTISVGETRYDMRDLEAQLSQLTDRERIENQRVLTRDAAISEGYLTNAINILVLEGIYKEEAKRLGVTVTDKMIQDYLNAQENLQNPRTGKFDATILQRLVQANNISVSEFKRRVASSLVENQINSALRIGVVAPDAMSQFMALRQTEERTIKTSILPVVAPDTPDDAALQSYYASHADKYSLPERRQYTYVLIDPEQVRASMEVDEADIAGLYASRAQSLGTPEKRSFVQAQFTSEDKAQRAAAAVAAGTPLAEAAETEGVAATQFTDEIKTNLIDDDVANAVFALDEPGLVGPIDGDFGYVVVDVSAITPAVVVTLDEVRDDMIAELLDADVGNMIAELYDEVQIAGDRGESLADAAQALDLDVRTVGPADRSYVTTEGLIEDNIPEEVHALAFTMTAGAIFEEVDLPDGSIAFVEVLSVTPETPRPFDEVQDQVAADYLVAQSNDAILDTGSRFEALIAQGRSFEQAAEEMGGQVVSHTLDGVQNNPAIPPAVAQDIFELPIGAVISAPGLLSESAFVAQVEGVRFTANTQLDRMTELLQNQMSQSLSAELFNAYLDAAQNDFGTERNTGEIAANFGLDQ